MENLQSCGVTVLGNVDPETLDHSFMTVSSFFEYFDDFGYVFLVRLCIRFGMICSILRVSFVFAVLFMCC